MPKLTVFTPTYNRAYTLNKCYQSLVRQSNNDFIWIIIDDGSTDSTREVVAKWIDESKIEIKYYYQKNQGMHGAHNTAYSLANTELCVCVDSDDYLADNAVENIVHYWNENGNDTYAGMVGMDAHTDGTIAGKSLPVDIKADKFRNIHRKYSGDKKYIYRTAVFNSYPPYPIFSEEWFTPLALKYYLIDDKYSLLILSKVLCYIEYLEDGSTKNMIHQYRKNPKGFLAARKVAMRMEKSIIYIFKEAIHYVMGSIMTKNQQFIKESPRKILTVFAVPMGIVWFFYVKFTDKNMIKFL